MQSTYEKYTSTAAGLKDYDKIRIDLTQISIFIQNVYLAHIILIHDKGIESSLIHTSFNGIYHVYLNDCSFISVIRHELNTDLLDFVVLAIQAEFVELFIVDMIILNLTSNSNCSTI